MAAADDYSVVLSDLELSEAEATVVLASGARWAGVVAAVSEVCWLMAPDGGAVVVALDAIASVELTPASVSALRQVHERRLSRNLRSLAPEDIPGPSQPRSWSPPLRRPRLELGDVASPVTIRHMEESKAQRRARLRREKLDREHEEFRQDVAAEGSGAYVAKTRRTARRLGALQRVLRASGKLATALGAARAAELEPEYLQHGEEIIDQFRSLRGWLGELEDRIATAAGIRDETSPEAAAEQPELFARFEAHGQALGEPTGIVLGRVTRQRLAELDAPGSLRDVTSQRCPVCGVEVEQPATGARRVYCSPAHRQAAYRARA
jgi:hypothetical protein